MFKRIIVFAVIGIVFAHLFKVHWWTGMLVGAALGLVAHDSRT